MYVWYGLIPPERARGAAKPLSPRAVGLEIGELGEGANANRGLTDAWGFDTLYDGSPLFICHIDGAFGDDTP